MSEIVLLLFVVLAVLIVIIIRQPTDFSISRSIRLSAPVSRVFAQVNVLRNWDAWSPWARLDPKAERIFEGPEAGVGAVMRWSGNRQVGVGNMTLTESRPDELIWFRLEFLKPFQATNTAEFVFSVEGDQVVLTWIMRGRNGFAGKAMGLIMSCDKMLGGQFEQGLSAIQSIVETA